MKIEYRTPSGGGAYVVLADEADVSGGSVLPRISGFQPVPDKQPPQVDFLAFASAANVKDMGNLYWTIRFGVERQHASADAAAAFIASHAAIFGVLATVDLKFTVGATVVTALAAAVAKMVPRPHSDQSTFFDYEFIANNYA